MRTLCAILLLATGCASMNQLCTYGDDDKIKMIRTRSTVVGTGETTIATTGCGALAYSTSDTGFSDNAEPVLGAVTEAAVKALVPVPLP